MPAAPFPHPAPAPGRIVETKYGPRYVPPHTHEAGDAVTRLRTDVAFLFRVIVVPLLLLCLCAFAALAITLGIMQGEIQERQNQINYLEHQIQQMTPPAATPTATAKEIRRGKNG